MSPVAAIAIVAAAAWFLLRPKTAAAAPDPNAPPPGKESPDGAPPDPNAPQQAPENPVRKAVVSSCFESSRRRDYMVYPDLAHGGAYQPRRSEGEEARLSGMTLPQLRTVVETIDGGKVWSWNWGPSWGRLNDHQRKVWARVRPGNTRHGDQNWDGKPNVVRNMDSSATAHLEKVAVHFIKAGGGMLELYRTVPRLDLPATTPPAMDNYQRPSRWESEAVIPRTPALDIWRVGQRVRDQRGLASRAGYNCNGVVWLPGSQTTNWKDVVDRNSAIEYLYSELGVTAVFRDSATGKARVWDRPDLLKPMIKGDRVSQMARVRGVSAATRKDAPEYWWQDSRAGSLIRAWRTLPYVGEGGFIR